MVTCYQQDTVVDEMNGARESDTEDSEDDLPEIDLSSGNKDTSVLEVHATFISRVREDEAKSKLRWQVQLWS